MATSNNAKTTNCEAWQGVKAFINKTWDESIVPCLTEYIRVPSQSPDFDPEWATNGLMEKAFDILIHWVQQQSADVKGLSYEIFSEPGRTPFLLISIEASEKTTDPHAGAIFMYGHMDKQPPMLPWGEGLGPYDPQYIDGKLYGRGGADDGYAVCAALTSITALQQQGIPHGRIVIGIEAAEESCRDDLEHYIQSPKVKEKMGEVVDLVICLDSGALNYDQLWLTSSLRGIIEGPLKVEVLRESIHSGLGGGVCPDAFRICRHLLDRIEDSATGDIIVPELKCAIPKHVQEELQVLNDVPNYLQSFPLLPGVQPEGRGSSENAVDHVTLGLRDLWSPSLTTVGSTLPHPSIAGNVIHSSCEVKLSIRLPPAVDAVKASHAVKKVLEQDPPYNSKVTWSSVDPASGWASAPLENWVSSALTNASQEYFGKPHAAVGLGGSIPFMELLSQLYPKAQFIVTGVLGPQSNAHGPNEFLHVPFAKGVNYCMAKTVAAHFVEKNNKK